MTIPPRFLDELRSRLTLSDMIGRRIKLTRAGREFKACCPFHNEKTPSFYVNDDKQFYHCFGCGAHGDVLGFVMRHDNLAFPEAVEMLAQEAGLPVPEQTPQEIERAKKQKGLHELLEEATRWMEAQLCAAQNKQAYQYIIERGVPEELLAAFRVGYAPENGQEIRKHLAAQGYSDAQMIEAGVVRRSSKGGEPYAFFRERIMFPVADRRGRVVAFGGRILPDHLREPDRGDFTPPKYINSSDTPLFRKGQMLFAESHARQAAGDDQPIIVVEGYLDVMACFEGGFKGAVAPLGTALTEEQIFSLWRMIPGQTKTPVLCFDGDNAGRMAASRAAARILPLLKPDHSAKIAFLPEGQDPDSLIHTQGAKAFQAVLDSALPLVDFLWQHHTGGQDFTTPEARAGLSKTLEQEALLIPDRDVQFYYRQALRNKQREAFGGFYQGARKGGFGRKGSNAPQQVSRLRQPAFSKERLLEMVLVATLLNHPELFEQVEEQFGSRDFSEKTLDRLRQAVLSTLSHAPDLDSESLQDHLINQGFEQDMTRVLSESVYTHAGFARTSTDGADVRAGWEQAWQALQEIRSEEALTG